LGSSAGVVVNDASRAGFAKAAAGLQQSKSVLVPQRFFLHDHLANSHPKIRRDG